jgi:hypothetical protein
MATEHKSEQMMQTALANGWKSEVIPDLSEFEITQNADSILWNVYCQRGHEALHVVFTGDRQTSASYSYGDYRLHPARRAGVMDLLTHKPNPKKFKTEENTVEKMMEDRVIPWKPGAPALDILLAVLGREISWIRKMDGEVLTSYIPTESNEKSRHFRVYSNRHDERFLEWTNMEGFHAVRLDSIIEVS